MTDRPEYPPLPEPVYRIHQMMCGCGNPEDIWLWILNFLEAGSNNKAFDWIDNSTAQFTAHVLNQLGIMEHGGSIYGSWPTSDGKEVLNFLQEFGPDFIDWIWAAPDDTERIVTCIDGKNAWEHPAWGVSDD